MPDVIPVPNEQTRLLPSAARDRGLSALQQDEASSMVASHFSKEELALGGSTVGERLAYNDYTTIDWLHDLVKDSYRYRMINSGKSLRDRAFAHFDACSGWIAVAVMGSLTACVAFIVDICAATVSDWKLGHCRRNPFMDREACCKNKTPLLGISEQSGVDCRDWEDWSGNFWISFGIYMAFALAFGIISATATLTTKASLPVAASSNSDERSNTAGSQPVTSGKVMYMAAGSGIPEIKTILSGFVIPGFLDFKVLFVKAFGAIFAVSTGMNLGKEGPFVHISGCVGYLVAQWFPKYRDNGRKLREILSASVASGLSVAFGAPIGGVLFSYEEISTYFPRKVLWRAFLCSLFAAIVLKALNPTGTGKLVLFETSYGTMYEAYHYLVFVLLGVAGGIWGGLFCKLNFKWSKWFRAYPIIRNHPVFEVSLVVLITVLLQYPNPLTREPGDAIIRNLLVSCSGQKSAKSWVCENEARTDGRWDYIGWLFMGTAVKLILTIITFGAKVPSGVIIPALDAGALFGRLIGQWIPDVSPGIFAMVGAAAFLAGVSRMTISLCVIMFELTGELEYIVPHMIAILVAKWVADSLGLDSVYDLAQNVLGHPFLDLDHTMHLVQSQTPPHLVERLIPPEGTMDDITVNVDRDNKVRREVLEHKLRRLKERGLMDAGVVLVQDGMLQGYLGEGELEFGLSELGKLFHSDCRVRLLGDFVAIDDDPVASAADEENQRPSSHSHAHSNGGANGMGIGSGIGVGTASGLGMSKGNGTSKHDKSGDLDMTSFVDRTPMAICEKAPMEYAVECFGRLGLRHLMITEEGSGRLKGVCLKKRLIGYLETLNE